MKMIGYLFIGAIIALLGNVHSDAVCDLNTFLVEVRQDLADNGMLDCLRVIEPPHFVEESEEQKNLRLAAQWDTSCSFEASTNWMDQVKRTYGISTLVDSVGEPVKQDFEEQADLCEILRAAVTKNVFNIPDLNMQKLPEDIIDKIDCAGIENYKNSPKICAVTGGSFFQKDSWTIFLGSSAIKFGGKPDFVLADNQPEPQQNPFAGTANPEMQTSLIKDLLKFSRDQLEMKEGELVNIIDRAQKSEKPKSEETEKDNEKGGSKSVHAHVKRLKDVSFVPANDEKYSQVDGGVAEFSIDKSKIIFGFYMVSFKFDKPSNIFFKLNFVGREMPESRQGIGPAKISTLSSSFAEVYNPKPDEKLKIKVVYQATGAGKVQTDKGDQNFSFGALTLPKGSVFKKINSGTLEFHKSSKWTPLPNFQLTINHSTQSEAYYLIVYNLAFPLQADYIMETRLKVGKESIIETSNNCGPTKLVAVHSAMVVKVQPGPVQVGVDYKYNGASVMLDDLTDSHYGQSIVAFELPGNTDVKFYKIDKPTVLDTNGEWKGFDLDATLELKKKQTILIIYNINLRVDNKNFSARIRIDSKYNKKSVFSSTGSAFATATGYVVKVMKPGKYTFDIDYKSDSQNTFNPETSELDGQTVHMQIILLD